MEVSIKRISFIEWPHTPEATQLVSVDVAVAPIVATAAHKLPDCSDPSGCRLASQHSIHMSSIDLSKLTAAEAPEDREAAATAVAKQVTSKVS